MLESLKEEGLWSVGGNSNGTSFAFFPLFVFFPLDFCDVRANDARHPSASSFFSHVRAAARLSASRDHRQDSAALGGADLVLAEFGLHG